MWAVVAGVTACGRGDGYVPQEGDLLFQVGGGDAFSEAITDATAWGDFVKFAHVGIVTIDEDGKLYVIEATGDRGVVRTEWDDFLEASPMVRPTDCKSVGTNESAEAGRGVVAMRVKGEFSAAEATSRAKKFIGQPYDWSYYPDNGKMYCSELVWECFLWPDGSRIFTAKPMNFRDSDGNMPGFWVELYGKLGEPIPEGVPGTNPNDMSKEPVLTEVYRFF